MRNDCSSRRAPDVGTRASRNAGHLSFRSPALALAVAIALLCFPPALVRALEGPLSPEQSLAAFQLEPGLRIELVAAEPMVIDPVAIAWDERGRMYVVEDRDYPTGPPTGQPPGGRVVLLEDTTGDDRFDRRTVFADGLTFPNGVMCWKGGVYVTCAPNLFYFKDTDGDGVADVKEIVFKGFQDLSTTQLRVSHPTLNLDNWIYLTSGLTAAKVISPAYPERPPVVLNRVDGRFRPGTADIEPSAGTAQFGQTFDRFGRKFLCSNRNHIQHVVMTLRHLKRNPHLSFSEVAHDIPEHGAACRVYPLSANIVTAASHGGYITSASGVMIYDGTALPDAYRGNSFVCESAANLVHRDVLAPNGVTFTATRAFPTNEFLASPDDWFRPVNLTVGPDGALYVCDMYRKTIEHPDYLPEAVRNVTDFESGNDMGRIYRVTRDEGVQYSVVSVQKRLAEGSVKQLCSELEHPNAWWRMTAHRLLLERNDPAAVPLLQSLAGNADAPETRIHALHLLERQNALTDSQIERAMKDRHPAVREHAIQLAETRLARSPALAAPLLKLASDPDTRVRFQCALALGEWNDDRIVPALIAIVTRRLDDKWTRAAVLTAIGQREQKFMDALLAENIAMESPAFPAMMEELGRIVAAAAPHDGLMPSLRKILTTERPCDLPWQMAAVGGFGNGLRARGISARDGSVLLNLLSEDSTHLRRKVEDLFKRSGELALDSSQTLANRLAAISLLTQADFAIAGSTLEALIEPTQPAELQTVAIRALGQMAGGGGALVERERWNAYTPSVREAVLAVLMANVNLLPNLLDAIDTGAVPAWTVNPERRNQLMKHKDQTIRDRATALFKDLQPGDRMKVYEEYKSMLALKGDSRNGRAVFQSHCANCHTFSGEGHLVGPDLTGIRNQPAEVMLLHIMVPEYEIMPIYTAYNVETKGGDSFTGLLAAESPTSITLRMAQGIEEAILRADIASMATSQFSLMPGEMEKAMAREEMADLIAFLKGEPPPSTEAGGGPQ